MINRSIRVLPFPLVSCITPELVRQIKAIPDDKVEYSQEEIEWLKRAVSNLKQWITESKESGGDTRSIYSRLAQIEEQLDAALKQKG